MLSVSCDVRSNAIIIQITRRGLAASLKYKYKCQFLRAVLLPRTHEKYDEARILRVNEKKKSRMVSSHVVVVPSSKEMIVFNIFYLRHSAEPAALFCPSTCARRGDIAKFLNPSTLLRYLASGRHGIAFQAATPPLLLSASRVMRRGAACLVVRRCHVRRCSRAYVTAQYGNAASRRLALSRIQ